MITLQTDRLTASIAPQIGASVTEFALLQPDGSKLQLMRPAPEGFQKSSQANFIMAPYSNRIRDARFAFRSTEHQLRFAEKHAIHGDMRDRPWKVVTQTATEATFEFDSREVENFNYPWNCLARVTYTLTSNELVSTLVLANTSPSTMPAGGGFHPYFMKALTPGELVEIQFDAQGIFLYEGKLPFSDQSPQAVAEEYNFSALRPVTEGIDHGYTGWSGKARFVWPKSKVTLEVTATDSARQAILYTPPGEPFFAFEPVSMSTDGFNLKARGAKDTGVRELADGEAMEIGYTLRVS